MSSRTKVEIGIAAALVAILCYTAFQHQQIRRLTAERDKYRANTETLLGDVKTYIVRDSLKAARVQSLELTVQEYERFRADDAELIKLLKERNRDLSDVNRTLSQTIIDLRAVPRDTVILVRDSVIVPAMAVHCGDAWYDFEGVLTADQFTGTLSNRDSVLLAETVRYKRFLGCLWKTRRVKDRQLDVVSRNPHTEILGVEHVVFEK